MAVYRYAARRTRQLAVHDVVAEVFAIAWRRHADVPDPPNDILWLYGVARRVVAQEERTEGRRRRLLAKLQHQTQRANFAPDTASSSQLSDDVSHALRMLRPDARELVRLIAWEQLSHAEAAEVLGCSVNAVAIRWHRALRRLRQEIGCAPKPTASAPEPMLCMSPPIGHP